MRGGCQYVKRKKGQGEGVAVVGGGSANGSRDFLMYFCVTAARVKKKLNV